MVFNIKKEPSFLSNYFSKNKDYYFYAVVLGLFYYFYQWHITNEKWQAFVLHIEGRVGAERVDLVVLHAITAVLTRIVYWLRTAIMTLIEYFPPTASRIAKYKTQPTKRVSLSQIAHASLVVLINQLTINVAFGYAFFSCLASRGNSPFQALPHPTTIALHLAFFVIIEEIGKIAPRHATP